MARSDDEVVEVLLTLYETEFGGKENARFLIGWSHLRAIYGVGKLFQFRFDSLVEAAMRRRLYVLDLGEGDNDRLACVLRMSTVDRWRKVPKRLIEDHRMPTEGEGEGDDDED